MDAGCGWNLQVPPHTGTTVVAVAYNGGVVLGADSRVSTGTYVSNRASDKLTPLSDFVWLLRSGSAADTQAVADYGDFGGVDGTCWPVRAETHLLFSCSALFHTPACPGACRRTFCQDHCNTGQIGNNSLLSTSVCLPACIDFMLCQLQSNTPFIACQQQIQASTLLCRTCFTVINISSSDGFTMCMLLQMNYQYKQLIGAMIVAGWDKENGGQVYGCPIGGTLVQENWTTDGSGSTYIWGYLDSSFR